MGLRINSNALDGFIDFAGERVEQAYLFDLGIEQFDTHRFALGIGRVNIDQFATYPVGPAFEVDVVASILQIGKPTQNTALVYLIAHHQVQQHFQIGFRVTESINRRYRGNDNRIASFK